MNTNHTTIETVPTAFLSIRLPRRLLPYGLGLLLVVGGLGIIGLRSYMPLPAPEPDLATAGEKPASARETSGQAVTDRPIVLAVGDIPLVQSLQERQARLEDKEQQLNRREEELRVLYQRIEEKLNNLLTLRKEVGALVEEKAAFEEKRFEHLVKVYEGMKAEEAASLIERLNEETAVKLLFRMKDKKVGQLLGFVKPDVAVKLSERLAAQRQKDLPKGAEKEKS